MRGILVVDADNAFCGELSRLAHMKGLELAFCWDASNLEVVPHTEFDAVIADAGQWEVAKTMRDRKVRRLVEGTPVVVVDRGREAPSAQEVLKAAMEASAGLLH